MADYKLPFTGNEILNKLNKVDSLETDKVDKVDGKGLSTNDFTTEEKQKLAELSNYNDAEVKKSIEELKSDLAPFIYDEELAIDWKNGISSNKLRGYYKLGQLFGKYKFVGDTTHLISIDKYSDESYTDRVSQSGFSDKHDVNFDGTYYIYVVIKKDDGSGNSAIIETSDIEYYSASVKKTKAPMIDENAIEIEKIDKRLTRIENVTTDSVLLKDKYYAHLFLNDIGTTRHIIPSESIYDIDISKRLGFNVIEANVHQTSDGKYVVIHGTYDNGVTYLGNQVEDLSGNLATDVDISIKTLSEIQSNYRYTCSTEKYKTTIPSLEEFLQECKIKNMIPLVQYCTDESVEICKKYFGNNFILYNGNRGVYDGMIMIYQNKPTIETITSWCDTIKPPFMACIGDVSGAYTDAELNSIVSICHSKGCLVGYSGNYKNPVDNAKLNRFGFDFASSGWEVVDFDNPNLVDANSDIDFSAFTRSTQVTDGVLVLGDDEIVTLNSTPQSCFLSKAILEINYVGTLGLMMGDYIKVYHTSEKRYVSDGSNSLRVSTFFMNQSPNFKIRSVGDVRIKSMRFIASKC